MIVGSEGRYRDGGNAARSDWGFGEWVQAGHREAAWPVTGGVHPCDTALVPPLVRLCIVPPVWGAENPDKQLRDPDLITTAQLIVATAAACASNLPMDSFIVAPVPTFNLRICEEDSHLPIRPTLQHTGIQHTLDVLKDSSLMAPCRTPPILTLQP